MQSVVKYLVISYSFETVNGRYELFRKLIKRGYLYNKLRKAGSKRLANITFYYEKYQCPPANFRYKNTKSCIMRVAFSDSVSPS